MKRKLLPLALSLALLAGCAPAPAPTPTAETAPSPTPAAAVDFHAFLDEVNETRRAVIEDGEPLDITAWTPDFTDQNHTFTDEAIETLLTRRDMVDYLSLEQAGRIWTYSLPSCAPPTGPMSTSAAMRYLKS